MKKAFWASNTDFPISYPSISSNPPSSVLVYQQTPLHHALLLNSSWRGKFVFFRYHPLFLSSSCSILAQPSPPTHIHWHWHSLQNFMSHCSSLSHWKNTQAFSLYPFSFWEVSESVSQRALTLNPAEVISRCSLQGGKRRTSPSTDI